MHDRSGYWEALLELCAMAFFAAAFVALTVAALLHLLGVI